MPTFTIRRNFKIEGVLTDVTSAKLRDATDTYGVKRNDTNAVVVASGEDMTKVSTGVYEYSFTALNGVAYTAWSEFVYAGSTYRVEHDFAAVTATAVGSMTCDYDSLVLDLAYHLFGLRAAPATSSTQEADILRCIAKGLQYVYQAHRWSFLRPLVSITTISGTSSYALPDEINCLEGPLTFPQGIDYPAIPLTKVPEVEIRRMLSRSITPSRPAYYAETMSEFDPTKGSSRYVTIYPVPDAAYILTAVGVYGTVMIDSTNKYPLGGDDLAPAIRESCLAAAEREIEGKDATHPDAVHNRALIPLLQQAIQSDKENSSPDTLGVDRGNEEASGPMVRGTGGIYWDAGAGYTGNI